MTEEKPEQEGGMFLGIFSPATEKFLRRWAPIFLLLVIVGGTVLVAMRPDPDYLGEAHAFQVARRDDDWEQVGDMMHEDFFLHGGDSVDLIQYLDRGRAHPQFRLPGPMARIQLARASEGLAVIDTDWARQMLCMRRDVEGHWKVMPGPFLLHQLQHDEALSLPEGDFSPHAEMTVLPRLPQPGTGQARILVDPVWIRVTPREGMRILFAVEVTGVEIDVDLRSVLAATSWTDAAGRSRSATGIIWTDIFPAADGVWPLEPGSWLLDVQWEDVPEGEFSVEFGTFQSEGERKTVTLENLTIQR